MISDILLNACDEITEYFEDWPEDYPDTHAEILAMQEGMRALALKLAAQPGSPTLVDAEDTL